MHKMFAGRFVCCITDQLCNTAHLAHHCADVAACFLALVQLPIIRARLEKVAERRLDEIDLDRLADRQRWLTGGRSSGCPSLSN